ncbi:hypothetical protein [Arthrobacter rhombi]|uniref:hypothetical protein n=1 Tax=Arthrobacter rhombi TaxID=71253 RepID=UPI003FD54E6A
MNATTSLRKLLQQAKDEQQLSGRRLADAAQGKGFKVTHATLNSILGGTYKSTPSVETIRAIAWLAGVSDEVAFTAAGQPVPGPPLADELPPGTDNLSPKSRKAVIEMLRVLIDLEASSHDDQEHAETNPSGERVAGEGGRRGGVGAGEKMMSVVDDAVPPLDLLAAHHNFKTDRDRFNEAHGKAGEETQLGPEQG